MKTTAEIIQELRSKGHTITTYTRTKIVVGADGESKRVADAVRIVGIDGMSFPKSDASGNRAAREMTGDYLSKRMVSQRRKARAAISAAKLTKSQKARIARLNKQLKEAGKKPIPQVTLRKRKKKEGFSSIVKAMTNTARHAKHISYAKNVEFWIAYWSQKGVMPRCCSYLKRHINTTSEDALFYVTNVLMESGHPRDGMTWEYCDEKGYEVLKQGFETLKIGLGKNWM